jgi:hypothetical protein
MNNVMELLEVTKSYGKTVSISPRQRLTLQRLLAGEHRKCSATALSALQRRGWVNGPDAGYQLTETGWRIAELSEESPPGKKLELQLN